MANRDLAADLEFWAGRARNDGAASDPERPLPSFRRRGPRLLAFLRLPTLRLPALPRFARPAGGRSRPIAAALLLAALTGAWLFVGQRSHRAPQAAAEVPATVAAPAPGSTTVTHVTSPQTSTRPAPSTDCRVPLAVGRATQCVVDGVDLVVQRYSPGTVGAAYRSNADAEAAPHDGPPVCAKGLPDERAWATAAAPQTIAGRYRCRIEAGRAAMWWTRGDRLVHAVARTPDLAGLFAWWRAHPTE